MVCTVMPMTKEKKRPPRETLVVTRVQLVRAAKLSMALGRLIGTTQKTIGQLRFQPFDDGCLQSVARTSVHSSYGNVSRCQGMAAKLGVSSTEGRWVKFGNHQRFATMVGFLSTGPTVRGKTSSLRTLL